MTTHRMNEQEFNQLHASLDRSGTWGAADRRGALNFINEAATLRGLAAATEGLVLSLARPQQPEPRTEGASQTGLTVNSTAEALPGQNWCAVNERIAFTPHGRDGMTHLDSFGHFYWRGATYDQVPFPVDMQEGVQGHDVLGSSGGIVTRGILVDLRSELAQQLLAPGESCSLQVLEQLLASTNITLASGDALFVRLNTAPAQGRAEKIGGLALDCADFLQRSEVSLIVSDAGFDSEPSEVENVLMPWHILTLTALGIHLVDLAELEELARHCERRHRWTFTAMVSSLPLGGATSSPVNPLAIL